MADQSIPTQTGEGGSTPSPLALEPGGWKASVRRTAKEFKEDRAALSSAGMAFYWFLAVFPALLAAIGVLGLVKLGPDAARSISDAIRSALPGQAAQVLTDSLDNAASQSGGASAAATVIGIVVALWSASAGMVALQAGLDVAYDVGQERTFAKKRLVALALLALTALLGGVATALIVFGAPLGDALREHLPFGGAFVLVWTVIRWVSGILALTVLFASYYYVAPNRDSPRWAWVSPGGIVATLVWLAASLCFSFYVSSFGSYARTYGSLAGVVVLLLWLYLSALAVTFGGELNAELERQAAISNGHGDGRDDKNRDGPPDAGIEAWRERMRHLRAQNDPQTSASSAPHGGARLSSG